MRKIFLGAIALLLFTSVGCRTIRLMNGLSVGMSKGEVIEVMGMPDIRGAKGSEEYFKYELARDACFVTFIDGKVYSYGRWGDFSSTKNPALDINLKK